MQHSDSVALRQSNGFVGEQRTAGILARYFVVLKSSVDRDGADFIIDLPKRSPEEERRRAKGIPTTAVVQAKFFEPGGGTYIDPSHATDDGRPRLNFFLFLHSDDEYGEPVRYFLTSEEIASLPMGANGLRRFSPTITDDYTRFRSRHPEEIAAAMRNGMDAYHQLCSAEYFEKVTFPLRMRASSSARDASTEYLLMRITLPHTPSSAEYCDARVVFARSARDSVARPIDARWDLYESTGTWSWGYKGEGPRLLAVSILAHYLGWEADAPSWQQHMTFLTNVIATLDMDSDHIVTGAQIEAILMLAP